MHTLKPLMLGFCLAASGAAVAAPNSASARRTVAGWPVVPDTVLGRLRGGIDLNDLVAYFAIERIVEVNGEVVARAEIVISNLDRLASGGLPTISVSGPLAQVVQIMNGGGAPGATLAARGINPAAAGAGAPVTSNAAPAVPQLAAAPAVSAASTPSGAATPASVSPPASIAPQTNGTISSGGTQSGSMAQFGSALSSAVAAAASATSATGAGNATAEAPSASAASLASAQPVAQPGTSAASTPSAAAASPASTPVPAGNAAAAIPTPIIVVSNLPNATAITTAVQNEVRATTIQTQTTISATLNSLPVVNSLALASAIQAQVASAVGR